MPLPPVACQQHLQVIQHACILVIIISIGPTVVIHCSIYLANMGLCSCALTTSLMTVFVIRDSPLHDVYTLWLCKAAVIVLLCYLRPHQQVYSNHR